MAIVEARGLALGYNDFDKVLNGADLTLQKGEIVALEGPSGSGKSSLLYCLAGLLKPTGGDVFAFGAKYSEASPQQLAALRRQHFGFVFQFAELVPELSLLENAALPSRLRGEWSKPRKREMLELFEQLGISDQADSRPNQVSGGQAQRAAVARAVFHKPRVIFADEPTGSLDGDNAQNVLDLFLALSVDIGAAVVLVTHDPSVAAAANRRLALQGGVVVAQHEGVPR